MAYIERELGSFKFLQFAPGDGTQYTAVWGICYDEEDFDNMYVGLGVGEYLQGGYFFRKSSLLVMAEELYKWVSEGKSPWEFAKEYHYFGYISGHMPNMKDRWEAKVIVLFAAVAYLGNAHDPEHLRLIEYVYKNRPGEVRDLLHSLGIREPQRKVD